MCSWNGVRYIICTLYSIKIIIICAIIILLQYYYAYYTYKCAQLKPPFSATNVSWVFVLDAKRNMILLLVIITINIIKYINDIIVWVVGTSPPIRWNFDIRYKRESRVFDFANIITTYVSPPPILRLLLFCVGKHII